MAEQMKLRDEAAVRRGSRVLHCAEIPLTLVRHAHELPQTPAVTRAPSVIQNSAACSCSCSLSACKLCCMRRSTSAPPPPARALLPTYLHPLCLFRAQFNWAQFCARAQPQNLQLHAAAHLRRRTPASSFSHAHRRKEQLTVRSTRSEKKRRRNFFSPVLVRLGRVPAASRRVRGVGAFLLLPSGSQVPPRAASILSGAKLHCAARGEPAPSSPPSVCARARARATGAERVRVCASLLQSCPAAARIRPTERPDWSDFRSIFGRARPPPPPSHPLPPPTHPPPLHTQQTTTYYLLLILCSCLPLLTRDYIR
ncbi:hypothetical protein FQA47_008179 [Oryzias melastigma]|uniref:Uncharacterized protein n=1 Tax=Oryzias melastigma TaxID=30732 RepID=A0A834CC87_ORYME|nr:hypothetical protein FQA47_008179 [Oryzias melastigma]